MMELNKGELAQETDWTFISASATSYHGQTQPSRKKHHNSHPLQ